MGADLLGDARGGSRARGADWSIARGACPAGSRLPPPPVSIGVPWGKGVHVHRPGGSGRFVKDFQGFTLTVTRRIV